MGSAERRRPTIGVRVGRTEIGGKSPVRVQSMTTTPTLDTAASVAQAARLAEAGAELVRLTAQGVSHAANLASIKAGLTEQGVDVPLVADIHFNPAAAYEAARHVDKVRINPGNFADPGRTFRKMEFTDEEYAAELRRIEEKLVPFIELCKAEDTAIRIGVNHGSLSDRIMSRYGDGPRGMVESAMEYLDICRRHDFDRVVVSLKASDVATMTHATRLLVETMDGYDMHYPLHLGVTEAGNAMDGRIKSAVGIGSLLADGIGDTIRVSLSEDPCAEIPVARALLAHIESNNADGVAMPAAIAAAMTSRRPKAPLIASKAEDFGAMPVFAADCGNRIARVLAQAPAEGDYGVRLSYPADMDVEAVALAAAVDFGYLLLRGGVGGIMLEAPCLSADEAVDICRRIVQATGLARFKAEIVACPGCGRTLFDLPTALERVKAACSHLRHLKIAVMGCIVNGPGEMAGADYGYVGAAAGNVSIYRGIEAVERNVPQDEAVDVLVNLIKSDGRWTEPDEK
ncbi:MAG: (E)-4-hydroxy-3-methylbut-2-enyl-diphosphate synthase [Muribaculaceae bacterium]|nr:(E)-4-hydroxy-3-methylbut-2-enyl-diphosphate synthase [Muribaculaceae bacterium]